MKKNLNFKQIMKTILIGQWCLVAVAIVTLIIFQGFMQIVNLSFGLLIAFGAQLQYHDIVRTSRKREELRRDMEVWGNLYKSEIRKALGDRE